jgi:hypothetical protein
MGLGKFQNSDYSTAFKGRKGSLNNKYFRKTWSAYLFLASKGILRILN